MFTCANHGFAKHGCLRMPCCCFAKHGASTARYGYAGSNNLMVAGIFMSSLPQLLIGGARATPFGPTTDLPAYQNCSTKSCVIALQLLARADASACMLKGIPYSVIFFQARAFRFHSRRHVRVMSVSNSATHKRKMVQIGTHNGTFHCDEALGCYLLRKTDRFSQGQVVSSRDQEVLKDLDIVIDVGGVYDPGKHLDPF